MKRELYHRISVQQIPKFGEDADEVHADAINEAIADWLKKNPQITEYRIVNVDTFSDSRTSLPMGIQSAYTVVHILYQTS